ncbi:polysaccharide pyruvyl transferase family protein [Bifidobacterium animalis]|uniref:Polysaccharide pyruvyl transferase n=1 Tax=Bifidobacterium animalis subsp. lactis TaxID=302911 RepID=A0A8B3RHG0_BIFAN|nr:polysaccharide pyruvyl transferase family protein [Bifidobacterium animalis]RYM93675.1 Polysaccharide pyruvyl transferase [Bifidobacterium animalis subsp. lactis]
MKKIGILTFTTGMNVGQRLQNYALQTLIEEEGFTAFTIRQKQPITVHKLMIRELLTSVKHPIKYLQRMLLFRKFNKQYIHFYKHKMDFCGPNREYLNNDFDAFIVGSDQIWNPNSPSVGNNFFLDFAPRSKRLTYAPSFSVNQIPNSYRAVYAKRLDGFDDISVREQTGAEIVKELTGKTATVVLDPTLLINIHKWNKLQERSILRPTHPYMLSFFLGTKPNTSLTELQESTGLPVVSIDADSPVGPSEALDLICHADLVATDSYHITIFSILYKRPFVNFQRKGTSLDMSSRFSTLYSLLHVTNRDWPYLKDHPREIFEMNFGKIQEFLHLKQVSSRAFLHNEFERLK